MTNKNCATFSDTYERQELLCLPRQRQNHCRQENVVENIIMCGEMLNSTSNLK